MEIPYREPTRDRVQFMSIEEFDRIQDAAEALAAADEANRVGSSKKKALPAPGATAPSFHIDLGTTNWIGKLLEYRNAHTAEIPTTFFESEDDSPPFTCMVKIAECPDRLLGNEKVSFGKRKDAKKYASKCAIDWLIENRYMPASGSVSFPQPKATSGFKTSILGAPKAIPSTPGSTEAGDPRPAVKSYRAKVAELATRLGMRAPEYKSSKQDAALALWDFYAIFPSGADVPEKIGHVHNVFGRDKAHEACAKGVLEYLLEIHDDRLTLNGQ